MGVRCGDDDNDGDGDYGVDHTVGRLGLVWYISAGGGNWWSRLR